MAEAELTTKAEKLGADAADGCLIAIGAVGFIVVEMIAYGYVLAKLWAWLIIPTFQQVPRLAIAQAIGLVLITRFIIVTGEIKPPTLRDIGMSIGKAAIFLICGFLLRRFI